MSKASGYAGAEFSFVFGGDKQQAAGIRECIVSLYSVSVKGVRAFQ